MGSSIYHLSFNQAIMTELITIKFRSMLVYTEEIHICSTYDMILPCHVEINFYKAIAYSVWYVLTVVFSKNIYQELCAFEYKTVYLHHNDLDGLKRTYS